MHTSKSVLLLLFAGFAVSAAWSVPVAGRGDPLLNPLFGGARQQSFSSMRLGEMPPRADVSVATVVNTGNPDGYSLRIQDAGGRFNTMGRFLAVERSHSFQLEFGFAGVTAFAFNIGRLNREMLVELYDDSMRLVESFRVRPLGPDSSGAYIGAYTPTVPVHYAVFSLDEAPKEALCLDNLTVVAMKPPTPPPPYAPARAASLSDEFLNAPRVPDHGSGATLLLLGLGVLLALRKKLG